MSSELFRLVKPGIVYGNMLHFSAGLLLAAANSWEWQPALLGFVATALIVASGCVVNNVLDRRIDRAMARTKHRATVTGTVSAAQAVLFALLLGGVGFGLLALTNIVTLAIGIVGFVSYALIYTYAKRFTVHHTLIGAVPGALPAVAGYTTIVGVMDTAAWWLFIAIFLWQLPHFYAIGVYRRKEYARAGVPLLSNRMSLSSLRRFIVVMTALYVVSAIGLAMSSLALPAGVLLVGMAMLWLVDIINDKSPIDDWARMVFRRSLVVALALPIAMVINLFATKWLV